MKKLIELFSKLPPQVKVLIAMAGLGSPAAVFYVIRKVLFPHWSSAKAFIAMAIFMIGIVLLGSLVVWLFNRGSKKRRDGLAGKLVEDTEKAPSSMDVRAKVKANNQKFVEAVRDMRKNLKVDVYDLPWYIVLGDSGCGKTRLINEGDLTFSAGKPEGYQLGTLDYNWWFTEDAVFIDMAGRLCNPQEDSDRREWLGVLDTLGKYRKGFPINGVIACVSAESLLRDSPEKQEQDANTMLERLRDLQQKLGVTFATYFVITKCDLIPGFMQFFDRTDRDATFKHQMFGWSRPGTFDERYDPDRFSTDFDAMYGRLSDWRLRRLNDDADESELGWAYIFPEQFRELREPLDIYVRKLFPLLKNPKGIKNLVFRGVYFTSATQQGAVILDHLKDRLGDDAGNVPLLEDLYPRPKPHFVKDLLFKKVFPEHGLVFRNEEQVHKNKRLARVVQVGNVVMAVVLFGLLGLSFHKFKGVVSEPTTHAIESRNRAIYDGNPKAALELSAQLGGDAAKMSQGNWVLSVLGWGSAQTLVGNLRSIRQRVFEEGVLRPCLMDVEQGLAQAPPPEATLDQIKERERSLIEYTTWCAASDTALPPKDVQSDFFRRSPALPDGFLATNRESLLKPRPGEKLDPIAQCLESIRARHAGGTALSKSLLVDYFNAPERVAQIQKSVEGLEEYYRPIARLEAGKADRELSDWMTLRTSWPAMMQRYTGMLQQTEGKRDTDWDAESFSKLTDSLFTDAKGSGRVLLADFEQTNASKVHVPTVKQKLIDVADRWGKLAAGLTGIVAERTDEEASRFAPVKTAATKLKTNLDETLIKAVAAPGGTDMPARVDAVHQQYQHIVAVDGATQHLALADSARKVRDVLAQIQQYVAATGPLDLTGKPQKEWRELLRAGAKATTTAPADLVVVPTTPTEWNEPKLKSFAADMGVLSGRQQRTRLLDAIQARLGGLGDLGWAALYDEACLMLPKQHYTLEMQACGARGGTGTVPRPTDAAPKKQLTDEEAMLYGSPTGPAIEPDKAVSPVLEPVRPGEGQMPSAAYPEFWAQAYADYYLLVAGLRNVKDTDYLRSNRKPVQECMDQAAAMFQRYHSQYVRSWNRGYEVKAGELQELLKTLGRAQEWNVFALQFEQSQMNRLGSEAARLELLLGPALSQLLSATQWLGFSPARRSFLQGIEEVARFGKPDWAYGQFAVPAVQTTPPRLDRPGDTPWDLVSARVSTEWGKLVRQFADNADVQAGRGDYKTIEWGGVARARTECRIEDEAISAGLVEVEERAKALLSKRLTDILLAIQTEKLGAQVPLDDLGWPYLKDEPTRPLNTLALERFRGFLAAVAQAKANTAPLEKGLENTGGYAERQVFYAQCSAWADFVYGENGLAKLQAARTPPPQDLEITSIEWIDPFETGADPGAPKDYQDTPQHFYRNIRLNLGLTKINDVDDDPEALPTSAGDRREKRDRYIKGSRQVQALWKWPSTVRLSWQYKDGTRIKSDAYADVEIGMGEGNELALCAYLCRKDLRERHKGREFLVEHSAEIKPAKGEITAVGFRLAFNLDREIPEPIKPIAAVKLGEPGGGARNVAAKN